MEDFNMTKVEKLNLLKNRLLTLSENPKNIKSPGVVRKLRRRVANMEKEIR